MRDHSLYRAVWRWHFYAGLAVLPVLVWLALTGGLYLYKPEIDRFLYRDWIAAGQAEAALPVAELVARIERQVPGKVEQISRPAGNESWRAAVAGADGVKRTAFVRADTGEVLGTTRKGGAMATVRELHSLVLVGTVGNVVVEVVAGWVIVLVLTGLYLWLPGRGQRPLALRGRPRERRFWRDFHASAGAIVGLVVLFLAVTGMPWSVFWGKNLQASIAAGHIGRPAPPGKAGGGHHQDRAAKPAAPDPARADVLPWSMQARPAPHGHGGSHDIGPDGAAAVAAGLGLALPYNLDLPKRPGDPYLFTRVAERSVEARTLYVDPSGAVLQDVSGRQVGAGARAIEWGIYTHQGQQYGEVNRLIMLAGCLGAILLAASAPVMWWKRRRGGRLEAPPRDPSGRQRRGLVAIMVAIGALFPLTGATMVAALAFDWLRGRRRAAV